MTQHILLWYISIAICSILSIDIGWRLRRRLTNHQYRNDVDSVMSIWFAALILGIVWPVGLPAIAIFFIGQYYETMMTSIADKIHAKIKD